MIVTCDESSDDIFQITTHGYEFLTVESTYPQHDSVGTGTLDPIHINFSQPVSEQSFKESFSMTCRDGAVDLDNYQLNWSDEGKKVTLSNPITPLQQNTLHTIKVNNEKLKSISGNPMQAPYTFIYITGQIERDPSNEPFNDTMEGAKIIHVNAPLDDGYGIISTNDDVDWFKVDVTFYYGYWLTVPNEPFCIWYKAIRITLQCYLGDQDIEVYNADGSLYSYPFKFGSTSAVGSENYTMFFPGCNKALYPPSIPNGVYYIKVKPKTQTAANRGYYKLRVNSYTNCFED